MVTEPVDQFEVGQKVAVIQQILQRDEVWTARVVGEVVRCGQRKTGSWYAHSKDDKLWLDRLVLRKEDGEIVELSLDANTRVELLAGAAAGGASEDTETDTGEADQEASGDGAEPVETGG